MQCFALLGRPVLDEIPGSLLRRIIVQQSHPESRQRAEAAPRAAVGPAHFNEALEAGFGEDRGEVAFPVIQCRALALQPLQPAFHEIAEGLARDIHVIATAIDEIHGHIECIIRVLLKPEPVLEGKGQHAGAVTVGIQPHMGAVGEHAVGLAFLEGRIGEDGGGERLQRQGDAVFLDHVGFRAEIEVHLHGGGAEHHVEPAGADFRHIGAHDLVAALRHHRGVFQRAPRGETEPDEARINLAGNFCHLGQVGVHLVTGLVQGLKRCAGQFKLASRFQGNGTTAGLFIAQQRNDTFAFIGRFPAEALHAFQHGLYGRTGFARRVVVGHGGEITDAVAELFVLGADPPIVLGL